LNNSELLKFKQKLIEIQGDVAQKIFETDLLIGLQSAFEETEFKSLHEMGEIIFKIDRIRMSEILEGRRMTMDEKLTFANYLEGKFHYPTLREAANSHLLQTIRTFGKENSFKFLGISQRTQQRYTQNIKDYNET